MVEEPSKEQAASTKTRLEDLLCEQKIIADTAKTKADLLLADTFEETCEKILEETGTNKITFSVNQTGSYNSVRDFREKSHIDCWLEGFSEEKQTISLHEISGKTALVLFEILRTYGENTMAKIFQARKTLGVPTRVNFT